MQAKDEPLLGRGVPRLHCPEGAYYRIDWGRTDRQQAY